MATQPTTSVPLVEIQALAIIRASLMLSVTTEVSLATAC
jgi:hypothetical protein